MVDGRSPDAPYVAYCPELEIASCGKDEDDARRMLKEAIDITLEDAYKRGVLEEYLEGVGFVKDLKKDIFIFPKVRYEFYYLSIPKFLENKFTCLV